MILKLANALDVKRRRGESDKGFTLIELLVVVLIIGILSAIAIPVFLNQRKGAWEAAVQSDIRNGQIAMETCATANNGSYSTANCTKALLESNYGLKSSPNVTLTITPNSTQYTIVGNHSSLTGTGSTFTYNSNSGQTVRS